MGLKAFQIIFDNPNETYYGGETVTGRVLLSLNSAKTIRDIEIRFKGEANVEWTETESRKNSDGTTEEHTVYFQGNEKYFESKYYLLGGRGDQIVLAEGEHCYPFTTTLPPKLPSSFEGEFGHIRYTVKVVINRPWKFDHEIKSAFTVISPVDLNTHETAKNPIKQEVEKRFCCFCCESGPLTMVLSLPVSGYVPGQDIPITLEIDNASDVGVLDVKCKLKKLITFIATSPYGSSREEEITLEEVTFPAVPPNNSKTATENMKIPPLPPSDLDNCDIIDLSYYLKVVAEVSRCHSDLKTSTPIVLGTVPLISYQIPSPVEANIGWAIPSGPDSQPQYVDANVSRSNVPDQQTSDAEGNQINKPVYEPSAPTYPDMPPPTYAECMFGPQNIQDAEDNEYTQGSLEFVPRYPMYNFVKQ
ncbi:arrestin domain-containing protein 17-like [Periplaneta americana]|uniref:arrestin domain-containing protein 17-like n=1 Tax=Periplaneta americana TaxID=6978 RepID=UPI0037E8D63A